MEIQYDKISSVEKGYNDFNGILTPALCQIINMDANGEEIYFSDEKSSLQYFDIADNIAKCLPEELMHEVYFEIDYNVANIDTDSNVKRYLTYVRTRVNTIYELLVSYTNFNDFEIKYWGDIYYFGLQHEGRGFLHSDRIAIKNPATNLRVRYLFVIEGIAVIRDHIDEYLDPKQKFQTIPSIQPNQPNFDVFNSNVQGETNKSAKSLFKNVKDQQRCIDMLKHIKPPIINDQGEFILGVKSKTKYPVTAWFDALDRKGLINSELTNLDERAAAINAIIPNLSITGRSLGDKAAGHDDKYAYFTDLIS